MISKMFFTMILLTSLFAISAQVEAPIGQCRAKIQGGVDLFPWSSAKPFPWGDIQGVWQMKEGTAPAYLRAKVIRTTSNRKILDLSVISEGNCTKPIAKGIGYIDSSERNVVRAIINDGTSKYQMKLALFDIDDLGVDTLGCEENVLAASLQVIGSYPPYYTESNTENIMLKKISDDLGLICKKPGTH